MCLWESRDPYIIQLLWHILRDMKTQDIDNKLAEIINLHTSWNLSWNVKKKVPSIPFLDMKIIHTQGILNMVQKKNLTDTGPIMNYHALAPKRYKHSVFFFFSLRDCGKAFDKVEVESPTRFFPLRLFMNGFMFNCIQSSVTPRY